MRNLGCCFASPILFLLRNGATKYQTPISIIRPAPSKEIRDKWHAENKSYNLGYADASEQYREKDDD